MKIRRSILRGFDVAAHVVAGLAMRAPLWVLMLIFAASVAVLRVMYCRCP